MTGAIHVDELNVISDLHLGGRKGFQIFGSTSELVWLIKKLTDIPRTRKVALVINGDFVDFLAEADPQYFDPLGAIEKLDRILVEDEVFKPILPALSAFARKQNRLLVINLGNHDLEIALPWVKEHLINRIAGNDPKAHQRIRILTEGSGALFQINATKIYCAHGNEVDPWNVTDHEMIRRIGRDLLQGKAYKSWVPNAGTKLVIDAMNEIKKEFPFVDLLKPEQGAVIPILAALKPSLAEKLKNAPSVLTRRMKDAMRMATGFLGDEEETENEDTWWRETNPINQAELKATSASLGRKLLSNADDQYHSSQSAIDMLSGNDEDELLGSVSAFWALATGKSTSEVVRAKLDVLEKDKSFDLLNQDETFKEFDELIGVNRDIIVTGHTHLERAVRRQRASGIYYNTGTWARLIEIGQERLEDADKFKEMFDAIEEGTIEALQKVPGLIKRTNTVLRVKEDKGRVESELFHVEKRKRRTMLAAVDGSRHVTG